jgi:hypothetical protein
MPSQFAAQTMSLGQLFAGPHLIQTPPYQRSFSWEQKEAGRLLEDLIAALNAEGTPSDADEYFLGTMLFIESERPASRLSALPFSRAYRVLEVVDGLQRLTTLTILFCLIRDLDKAEGRRRNERLFTAVETGQGANVRHRLTLRNPDEAFLQECARRPGATRAGVSTIELSPSEERILEVRDCMRQSLQDLEPAHRQRLADFLLEKCHVVVVSTTGIDRAHRMFTVLNARGKPLNRHDILKADLLGGVPPPARERTTAIWDKAKLRLGEEFEDLFSHLRIMYARNSAPVITAVRAIANEVGGGEAFVGRILNPAADVLDHILHPRHMGSPHSQRITSLLTYLGWLKGQGDWVPPLMLWWLGKGQDPEQLVWFLTALDRLAFGLRIMGHGTKRRAGRFGAVVTAIKSGRDLRGPSSPLNLGREELRSIHHNLRDLHARSAPMAKLVLLRLNDQIAGSPQAVPFEDLSVEHLLPRKPGINSPWRQCFPDPGERDRHTESLGNLVLVSKAQNDKAGNLDFARKKDVLLKAAAAPHLPLNEYVWQQPEWTSRQIKEREARLFAHLDELWGIGLPPSRQNRGPAGDATAARLRKPQTAGA